MTREHNIRRKDLLKKHDLLTNAKATLKQEFFGIDTIIDEVIDCIQSWYLFPDMQERPVIVNLWGLTGVGKTALVHRLAKLLQFEQKYFHFDLGDNDQRTIKRQLEELNENLNGLPLLLSLDEFQHARTIDETGYEIAKSTSRIVWQLVDTGKFQISRHQYHLDELYHLILKLKYLLRNGVKVSNGKVTAKTSYYTTQMEHLRGHQDKENTIRFVPDSMHDAIYNCSKELFGNVLFIQEKLDTLDGFETVQFLQEVFDHGNSPKLIDCSKSLIFVIGNLDHAYKMSHDFNPDMNADEFHEQSLGISITTIKRALKEKFRNEQIARLGNTHIIYPAFNQETYRKIIDLELSKISAKIYEKEEVKISFDKSISKAIYNEGVYPTQGTRPLFSTIHTIISSKLGKVIAEMILKEIDASHIHFRADKNAICIEYYSGKDNLHSFLIPQEFKLEKLRKNTCDDLQAIVAVHEAGHAILSITLLGIIPEVIYSHTINDEIAGLTYSKSDKKYISKKDIPKHLAVLLGGYVAEKIVFGEDNLTSGSSDDIKRATQFITHMLKQHGMGAVPANYHVQSSGKREMLLHRTDEIDEEAEKQLSLAAELATSSINANYPILMAMISYLSKNRRLTKSKLLLLLRSNNLNTLLKQSPPISHRDQLNKKLTMLTHTNNISILCKKSQRK